MTLTNNQKRIIKLLLRLEEPLSHYKVGSLLNLSSFQVRHELAGLAKLFSCFGIELMNKPGTGLYIVGSPNCRANLSGALKKFDIITCFDKEECYILALVHFFLSGDYLKLDYLSYHLPYSNSSVSGIIKEYGRLTFLNSYGLALESKKGCGIRLTGSREKQAAYAASLITTRINLRDFHDFLFFGEEPADDYTGEILRLLKGEEKALLYYCRLLEKRFGDLPFRDLAQLLIYLRLLLLRREARPGSSRRSASGEGSAVRREHLSQGFLRWVVRQNAFLPIDRRLREEIRFRTEEILLWEERSLFKTISAKELENMEEFFHSGARDIYEDYRNFMAAEYGADALDYYSLLYLISLLICEGKNVLKSLEITVYLPYRDREKEWEIQRMIDEVVGYGASPVFRVFREDERRAFRNRVCFAVGAPPEEGMLPERGRLTELPEPLSKYGFVKLRDHIKEYCQAPLNSGREEGYEG